MDTVLPNTTGRGGFQKVGKELCGCGDSLVRFVFRPRSTDQSSGVLKICRSITSATWATSTAART